MKNALLLLVVSWFAVLLTGCGTACKLVAGVLDPVNEPTVYGGVTTDLKIIDEAVNHFENGSGTSTNHGDPRGAAIMIVLLATDPVLSFVADTVLLPVTIMLQNRRIAREREDHPSIPVHELIELKPPIPLSAAGGGRSPDND